MTGLVIIVWVRIDRLVRLCIGKKHKERFIAVGFALDEVDGLIRNFAIRYFEFRWRFTALRTHYSCEYSVGIGVRIVTVAVWPNCPIRGTRNADPFVKSLVRGKRPSVSPRYHLPNKAAV
jgi:hypothetical protein